MIKKKILVFTGAGISAESGIKTYRDHDGLWENFSVDEVASIQGWENDPQKVLDFYNARVKELKGAKPNDAHKVLAEMEKDYDITIVTQNVDDLHEKAGSTNIIHLHGELTKLRSELTSYRTSYDKDVNLGDLCPDGYQLRPDIVWFGEVLDSDRLDQTRKVASEADYCIVVGTSMQVAPASSIPWLTKETTLTYYVDPGDINFTVPKIRKYFFYHFEDKATVGVPKVYEDLKKIAQKRTI